MGEKKSEISTVRSHIDAVINSIIDTLYSEADELAERLVHAASNISFDEAERVQGFAIKILRLQHKQQLNRVELTDILEVWLGP